MDCIFCKICKNEIPSYTIYEDEKIKVFLDVNPNSNGHTLIIPKEHYKDLDDIPIEIINSIFSKAKDIKKLLENKLKPDGIKLVQNNGTLQEVKHFHLHLIPYYKNNKNISIEEVYKILNN